MARTLYVYTDEAGTAHAVADWSQVPAQFRSRAKAVASQEAAPSAASSGAPSGAPLGQPEQLPRALKLAAPLIGLIVVWKVSKSFLIRTAAVVAVAFWLYLKAFDWFNAINTAPAKHITPEPGSSESSEASSDQPAEENAGTVEITPAK
ncbi:MAG: hypothetical protein NTX64_04035 [Elusimicrobia bacterium]|nr:hypothetical protein [Elusimicrobiota bacterium]